MSEMEIINSANKRIPITTEGCAEVMLLRKQLAEELKRSDRRYVVMDEYRNAHTKLEAKLAELQYLLTLIRDDLRMRSEDGVVDISDFIWMRIDKVLQEKGD